jgi:DNA-directed RNA polymerase specialized sigma24 family protein
MVRVLPVDRADVTDDYRSISERDELEQAFRQLPLDQRAVFILRHHVGLPVVDVADALGIPDGAARSRLHDATRTPGTAFEASRMPVEVERRQTAWTRTEPSIAP